MYSVIVHALSVITDSSFTKCIADGRGPAAVADHQSAGPLALFPLIISLSLIRVLDQKQPRSGVRVLPGQDIPSHPQAYLCVPQDPGRGFLVFYLFSAILGFQCGEIYDSILRRQAFVAYYV